MSIAESHTEVAPAFLMSRAVNGFIDGILPQIALIQYFGPFTYIYPHRVMWLSATIIYYFLFEIASQRTLGKLITGTVVVDEDGSKPTVSQIALRTLIRMIPFEQFSGVFSPDRVFWHDRWSKTRVVRKNG